MKHMLEVALPLREAVDNYSIEHPRMKKLNLFEWAEVEQIAELLAPLEDGT